MYEIADNFDVFFRQVLCHKLCSCSVLGCKLNLIYNDDDKDDDVMMLSHCLALLMQSVDYWHRHRRWEFQFERQRVIRCFSHPCHSYCFCLFHFVWAIVWYTMCIISQYKVNISFHWIPLHWKLEVFSCISLQYSPEALALHSSLQMLQSFPLYQA